MAFLTMTTEVGISTYFLGACLFLLLYWILQKPKNLPPGPFAIPLIGCIPTLAYFVKRTGCRKPHQLFAYLASRYGNVFIISVATKIVVILNDFASIREAFRNPLLNDRPSLVFLPKAQAGILMCNGPAWVRQRRFTLNTFRDFGIGKSSFQDQIADEVVHMKEELVKYKSSPIDPHQFLSTAISNVICSVVLGKRFDYSDVKYKSLLHDFNVQTSTSSAGGLLHFLPFLANFFPKFKEQSARNAENLASHFLNVINEHIENFDRDNVKDYIDVYLREMERDKDPTPFMESIYKHVRDNSYAHTNDLTDHHLLNSVIHLFIAGSETTTTTLRWCFLYTMAHKDVQTRIHEEIDSVVGRNRLPRLSDKLPFTEATLLEVQRISTITPTGVPHVAAEDTMLKGYFIPKGAILMPNLWAVHNDPNIWHEPDQFRPERFLNEDGDVHYPEENYAPFSVGRRNCIGENLAKMEMFIFFTHMLHQYSIQKPTDSGPISFENKLGSLNAPYKYEMVLIER